MVTAILGNGINIQFGGIDNLNQSIISRAIKSCKESTFPKEVILDEPQLFLELLGHLFLEVKSILNPKYDRYAISSQEKKSLHELREKYGNQPNLKLTDIGFEDYYLIFDLFCHKFKIVNPEKFHARQSMKSIFIYAIFNHNAVNNIYRKYPNRFRDFLNTYDSIYTTNYDTNLETYLKREILYLHGAFHIRANVYNPESFRNKLSDCPMKDYNIDERYYYIYSNVLTDYSGFSKDFSLSQNGHANEAVEKMAKGYLENEQIRKDVDTWADSDNLLVRNMYESIMLKIQDPSLRFEENYPINEFRNIEGQVDIIGLSPCNDTHIFDSINTNNKISDIIYYYYEERECNKVKELIPNHEVKFLSVVELWNSLKED